MKYSCKHKNNSPDLWARIPHKFDLVFTLYYLEIKNCFYNISS